MFTNRNSRNTNHIDKITKKTIDTNKNNSNPTNNYTSTNGSRKKTGIRRQRMRGSGGRRDRMG
eukprot:710264-Pyramimonas_sp.AAC.1